jgi:hypothetical protein
MTRQSAPTGSATSCPSWSRRGCARRTSQPTHAGQQAGAGSLLRGAGGEASGSTITKGDRERGLQGSAPSVVGGRCPPGGRHAAVAGIVRHCDAGERSHRDARSADPRRGTVPEARIGGIRRLCGESPVPADPVSLVSQSGIPRNHNGVGGLTKVAADRGPGSGSPRSRSRRAAAAELGRYASEIND